MKANALLKHNIDALLRTHGQKRKDLAQWCHRTESWISKIFREERREIPIQYLDRIADFFGRTTYELFLPGLAMQSERRSPVDRRVGRERRIGHAQRDMMALRAQLPSTRRSVLPADETALPAATAIHRVLESAARQIDRLVVGGTLSGEQAPAARAAVAAARTRARKSRGSDVGKT